MDNMKPRIIFLIVLPFLLLSVSYWYFLSSPSIQISPMQHGVQNQWEPELPAESEGQTCNSSIRTTKSTWFRRRFDPKIQPFLTIDSMKISPATISWWRSIQKSNTDNWQNTLMALFKQGIPMYDVTFDDVNKDCISCAVVGNSDNLRNSKYGEVIDSHDIVIRFNRAVTKRFESDVGSKTTHQFMYPESAISLEGDTSFTLLPFKALDISWMLSAITIGNITRTYQAVPNHISCNVSRIVIINPEFMRYVYLKWLEMHGRYPSSGMLGIALALQKCDKVDLFGFGADKSGAWQHYWEVLPDGYAKAFRKTDVHNADFERDLIAKLEEEGIAKVYAGTR